MELKIPPPVLFALALLVIFFLPQSGQIGALEYVAVGLACLLGFVCAISSIYAFYRANTTVNPHDPNKTSTLVTTGIYRVTRNPMYMALLYFLVAFSFWQTSLLGLFVVLGVKIYLTRYQIMPEERILAAKFPKEYAQYQQRVPRWFWK
ncbi:hypothetical protein A4G19_02480 [Pasteurellaceae bacterium Macca]|nr:hypothetical protein [Pasteurellaceae bacterium Macca]